MNNVIALILAVAGVAGVAVMCLIASELRAIRKVHQARWDYDRFSTLENEYWGRSKATLLQIVGEHLLQKPQKFPDKWSTPLRSLFPASDPA